MMNIYINSIHYYNLLYINTLTLKYVCMFLIGMFFFGGRPFKKCWPISLSGPFALVASGKGQKKKSLAVAVVALPWLKPIYTIIYIYIVAFQGISRKKQSNDKYHDMQ